MTGSARLLGDCWNLIACERKRGSVRLATRVGVDSSGVRRGARLRSVIRVAGRTRPSHNQPSAGRVKQPCVPAYKTASTSWAAAASTAPPRDAVGRPPPSRVEVHGEVVLHRRNHRRHELEEQEQRLRPAAPRRRASLRAPPGQGAGAGAAPDQAASAWTRPSRPPSADG